jgi:hypothetical protein
MKFVVVMLLTPGSRDSGLIKRPGSDCGYDDSGRHIFFPFMIS